MKERPNFNSVDFFNFLLKCWNQRVCPRRPGMHLTELLANTVDSKRYTFACKLVVQSRPVGITFSCSGSESLACMLLVLSRIYKFGILHLLRSFLLQSCEIFNDSIWRDGSLVCWVMCEMLKFHIWYCTASLGQSAYSLHQVVPFLHLVYLEQWSWAVILSSDLEQWSVANGS